MIERLHLSVILLAAAIIWGFLLVIEGVSVSISWLGVLSPVVGILLLLLAAFDLWIWKWRLLHPWFVRRPIISGSWRVELRSNWVDPATKKKVAPIHGCMVIRQTFSRIRLRQITEESQSELLGAEILRADDGTYRLFGIYRNEPKLEFRKQSPIHYGGLVLQVDGTVPLIVEGHYWTDRNTAGELVLSDRRPGAVESWSAAAELFDFSDRS